MSLGRENVKVNHLIVEGFGSVTRFESGGPKTYRSGFGSAKLSLRVLKGGEGLFLLSYLVLAWRLPSRPKYSVPLPITACRYSTAAKSIKILAALNFS